MNAPVIYKAISGFYYVKNGDKEIVCRARGRFRNEGVKPLVGDYVEYSSENGNSGIIERILARKNSFLRPAIANIDCMIILACAVNPVTDPFLIDRVTVVSEHSKCKVIICINKSDIDPGDDLFNIYEKSGYKVIRTSAKTGEGIAELRSIISGEISVFTGNSGVGKSSILNALSSDLNIRVGEVSEKLGRGRHTTRHVELFAIGPGTYIADTPGFSSFDFDRTEHIPKDELQFCFREFLPFLGKCRFEDCAHIKEPGCAVIEAVNNSIISLTRHENYAKLFEFSSQVKVWELK